MSPNLTNGGITYPSSSGSQHSGHKLGSPSLQYPCDQMRFHSNYRSSFLFLTKAIALVAFLQGCTAPQRSTSTVDPRNQAPRQTTQTTPPQSRTLPPQSLPAPQPQPLPQSQAQPQPDWEKMNPVQACDVLASHPDDPEAYAAGVSNLRLEHDKVIKACEAAIKLDKKSPRLNFQLARGYLSANRLEEAIEQLLSAAKQGHGSARRLFATKVDATGISELESEEFPVREIGVNWRVRFRRLGKTGIARDELISGIRKGGTSSGERQSSGDYWRARRESGLSPSQMTEMANSLPPIVPVRSNATESPSTAQRNVASVPKSASSDEGPDRG